MRVSLKWLGLAIASVIVACAGVATQGGDPLTVVLVRHAERAPTPPEDPDLSPEGEARVEVLTRMLQDANVTAAYATQFQRTQQTAAPVAMQAGVEVTVVPAASGAAHIDDMASRIRSHGPGEVVVVAGHSNTIPPMVNALTGQSLEDLEEDQYDRLYLVSIHGDGPGSLVILRYGPSSP